MITVNLIYAILWQITGLLVAYLMDFTDKKQVMLGKINPALDHGSYWLKGGKKDLITSVALCMLAGPIALLIGIVVLFDLISILKELHEKKRHSTL